LGGAIVFRKILGDVQFWIPLGVLVGGILVLVVIH